jgi:protein TonB
MCVNKSEKPKVMETKKNASCDLECYRNLFVEIGLVLALGICLVAFEVKTKVEKASIGNELSIPEIESEIVPITRQEEVKPPEPPPPPKVVEILNIVADDVELDDELEIEDTEADQETAIDVSPLIGKYQQTEKEADEAQIFYIVEDMPEFPGGELALRKFLSNAIKYPVIAQENGIEGKVYVSFVVGKDGHVADAKVVRGVDPSLDKEAIRVVNSLPVWKPGKQRGKPVRVGFSVPISFVLQ